MDRRSNGLLLEVNIHGAWPCSLNLPRLPGPFAFGMIPRCIPFSKEQNKLVGLLIFMQASMLHMGKLLSSRTHLYLIFSDDVFYTCGGRGCVCTMAHKRGSEDDLRGSPSHVHPQAWRQVPFPTKLSCRLYSDHFNQGRMHNLNIERGHHLNLSKKFCVCVHTNECSRVQEHIHIYVCLVSFFFFKTRFLLCSPNCPGNHL